MIWARIASILMVVAVMLGAFGAHGLKSYLSPEMMKVYQTGVFYHMIHALGLFAVAWLTTLSSDFKIRLAGVFHVFGIVLFSGSLYVMAIADMKWFGRITPIGGVSFIMGWLLLAAGIPSLRKHSG